MATVDSNAPQFDVQIPIRKLTAADLAALPEMLPSGPVSYELFSGRLIMMSPTAGSHGEIQAAIARELGIQAVKPGFGKVWVESGFLLRSIPDTTLFGPDVAFICSARLPVKNSKEGFIETLPDLVVEIRSKNDTKAYLLEKTKTYLAAGVGQVWVAEPETHTITIHASGKEPQQIEPSGSITDREFPLIPDLNLVLAEVFPKD
jgi:Uma2 family endonuclease